LTVVAKVSERLAALTAAGTAVWLDQISRSLTRGGELQRLVKEDSLRGVTSNPAIFEKAILGSVDYDDQIEELARAGTLARVIYQEIAIQEVQEAADVLRPVHDQLEGRDGFVSLEVDPDLAFDSDRTIAQAREYWQRVDRPNTMIKIPGTAEGLPAIEQAVYEGINVNVTLLFGVEVYARVAEAYIRGLERRHAEGLDLAVHSVASFFVSRVDSEVDKRLKATGHVELCGGCARQRAYRLPALRGDLRRRALRGAARGGRPRAAPAVGLDRHQEPCLPRDDVRRWARGTGNRQHHADGDAARLRRAPPGHRPDRPRRPAPVLHALADAGIDMTDVTDKLLRDGIDAFVTPMRELLAGIEAKRDHMTR